MSNFRNDEGVVRDLRGWKSVLKADPTEWLLGEDNPSVRYFMLLDVLDKSENDLQVEKSRKAIMQVGAVPKILSKQKSGGFWGLLKISMSKASTRGQFGSSWFWRSLGRIQTKSE